MEFISTNNAKPTELIYSYISSFGGIVIAFAIVMVGIKMLLSINKQDTRERAMEALGKIIAGGFVTGTALILAGFIAWIADTSGIELITTKTIIGNNGNSIVSDGDATFIVRAVASLIEAIPNAIFEWITKGVGFQALDTLVFNKNPTGLPPFSDMEWHNLNYLYVALCTIVAPLLLIMIGKTGFGMILFSDSTSKKMDLKEEISGWIFCAVLLGIAPFFVLGLFELLNGFTAALGLATNSVWNVLPDSPAFSVSAIQRLQTGNLLVTAIIHLLYAWQIIKINLAFMSRKIVLAVMYSFTPLAISLWGINHKVRASSIWLGEMITNASMQFFYAFTFTVMIVALGSATWNNWLLAIIWMTALVKVADMLRNSLRGFFSSLAGIDDASLGSKAFGSFGTTFAGMTAAFGQTLGNGKFKGADVGKKVFGETMPKNFKGSVPVNIDNVSSRSSANLDVKTPNNAGTLIPTNTQSMEGREDIQNPVRSSNLRNNSKDDLKSFKNDSQKQSLYNSLLADNLNREMSKPNRKGITGVVGGALSAMTAHDPMASGFVQGIGNLTGGHQNRQATASAINKTAEQMQHLSGIKNYEVDNNGHSKPVYNMSKQQALSKLFGDKDAKRYVQSDFKGFKVLQNSSSKAAHWMNDKATNAVNSTVNAAKEIGSNKQKFISNIAKGDNDSATMNVSNAHPYTNSTSDEKLKIIAQTNSYTNVDGFNNWK